MVLKKSAFIVFRVFHQKCKSLKRLSKQVIKFDLIKPNKSNPLYPFSDPRDAYYLIREIDIHSVTGLLKLYLRELPESLFTNDMYQKYFEARGMLCLYILL